MRKHLAVLGWLAFIYLITALNDQLAEPPNGFWETVAFEAEHLLAHGLTWGIQAALIARAVGAAPSDPRVRRALVLLITTLGFGQEVLQSLLRSEITPLGSLWDLLVDAGGAAFGLWANARWMARRVQRHLPRSHPQPDPLFHRE